MISKEYLDKFLETGEQDLLTQFADNEVLKNAVRKVLLFSAYNSGVIEKGKPHDPLINFALTIACQKGAKNEDIGADVKACWEAINEIEMGLKRIDMYKSQQMPEFTGKNPAR